MGGEEVCRFGQVTIYKSMHCVNIYIRFCGMAHNAYSRLCGMAHNVYSRLCGTAHNVYRLCDMAHNVTMNWARPD